MSNKKKGYLTVGGSWRKHLRKWGRRIFWGGERMAGKEEAQGQLGELYQPFRKDYE